MAEVRTSRQMFEAFLRVLRERERALGEEFERVKFGLTSVQQEIQSVEAYLDKERDRGEDQSHGTCRPRSEDTGTHRADPQAA